jgi:hypothetical protein
MIAPMRQDALPVDCCARWTRSGCFSPSMGLTPPITGPNGPCVLECSGANARRGRLVTKAIAGWSAFCRSKRHAVCEPGRLTLCWLTRSHVAFTASSLISPGFSRLDILFPPVTAHALLIGFRDTASQHLGLVTGRSCGLRIRSASLPKFVNTTMARSLNF